MHFDPTGWYEGKRMQLIREGKWDMRKWNPIAECKKHKQTSINIGHKVHKGIEQFLTGASFSEISSNMDNNERVMLSYFTDWCSRYKPKVVAMEEPLYSHEYEFAGTPDLVCTLRNGKTLYLVDWKTDATPNTKVQERERLAKYLWQIAGYSVAYQETHGICINKGFMLRADKKLRFEEIPIEDVTQGIREFKWLREIYRRVKGK